MEYLIAWIVLAAAAGSLAKGKNRNVVVWFVVGLLLGPFAVLIVALMAPAEGEDQGYR